MASGVQKTGMRTNQIKANNIVLQIRPEIGRLADAARAKPSLSDTRRGPRPRVQKRICAPIHDDNGKFVDKFCPRRKMAKIDYPFAKNPGRNSMEIKVGCGCGQNYKFDVEPVSARMPVKVACPSCGADGTESANHFLAQQFPNQPPPIPVALRAQPAVAVAHVAPPG